MSEKKTKKCGECGKEIKGEGKTVWKEGKLIMTYCQECYDKSRVKERIKRM